MMCCLSKVLYDQNQMKNIHCDGHNSHKLLSSQLGDVPMQQIYSYTHTDNHASKCMVA